MCNSSWEIWRKAFKEVVLLLTIRISCVPLAHAANSNILSKLLSWSRKLSASRNLPPDKQSFIRALASMMFSSIALRSSSLLMSCLLAIVWVVLEASEHQQHCCAVSFWLKLRSLYLAAPDGCPWSRNDQCCNQLWWCLWRVSGTHQLVKRWPPTLPSRIGGYSCLF